MFRSLVCAVSEQCQEIKQAMSLFPYFENWDANTIAECCRVSSTAEFSPNRIILGPGVRDAHTVHFVLSGVCRVVRHLLLEVKVNSRGKVTQKLFKSSDPKKALAVSEADSDRYMSKLFSQREQSPNEEKDGIESLSLSEEKSEKAENKKKERRREEENSERPTTNNALVQNDSESMESEQKIIFESDHHLKVLEECRKRRETAICGLKTDSLPERPENVKSLFIETATLFAGASFGLGKLGKEDFVISQTAVKVLRIPLRFLLLHNPCNIWNRISLFHSLYLFGDDKIFEYYQNERKWTERKKNQTEEIVSAKNAPNYTLICDVPYSIRLSTSR